MAIRCRCPPENDEASGRDTPDEYPPAQPAPLQRSPLLFTTTLSNPERFRDERHTGKRGLSEESGS